MKTVLAMHWPLLLGALALQLAYSGAQFAGPELLNQITKYLQTPRQLQVGELSTSCLQVAAAGIIAGCHRVPPMSQAARGRAWPCSVTHAVGLVLLLMAAQSALSPSSALQRFANCQWTTAAEIIAVPSRRVTHCSLSWTTHRLLLLS